MRTVLKKNIINISLVTVGFAVLLLGCGPAAAPVAAPAEESVSEAAPVEEESVAEAPAEESVAEAPAEVMTAGEGPVGGTLVTGALLGLEPKSLNPNFRRDDGSLRVAAMVYCQLVYSDYVHGTGVYPELADSWEANADASEFTFHLVENATWHDGQKVTSADVAWSFNETIDKEGAAVEYLQGVTSIETPDDHTIKITLEGPNAAFLDGLGGFYGPKIMPKHLYEGTDWSTNEYNDNPVGCGPFKFVEWEKGSHIAFEANSDFYRGRPLLDRVVTRFFAMESLISAYEAGDVKYSYENFPFSEVDRLKADSKYRIDINRVPLLYWLGFNFDREPWGDVRVRQAISLGIDREEISERAFQGNLPATYGSMPKGWAYNATAEAEYDPERAKQLLEEAGLEPDEDGVRLRTTLSVAAVMGFPDVASVIQEQLRDIDVELTIESTDWAGFVQKVIEQRDYDLGTGGGNAGPDPAAFEPFVVTDGYRNMMGYSNPELDALFEKARSTSDIEERKQAYFEAQEILKEEMPRISLLDSVSAFPVWSEVKNVYWDESVIGKPSKPEYSFLYTYIEQ